MKGLTEFINESLVNESQNFLDGAESYPDNWDLADIFDETDGGKAAKLKQYDWTNYFDVDFVDEKGKDIIKLYTNFFAACDSVRNADVGNVGEDEFNDEEIRDYADISSDECGVALHKDGDDGTWTIITFKKPINKLPKPQQTAILDLMTKYSDSGWYYVEYFDAI